MCYHHCLLTELLNRMIFESVYSYRHMRILSGDLQFF